MRVTGRLETKRLNPGQAKRQRSETRPCYGDQSRMRRPIYKTICFRGEIEKPLTPSLQPNAWQRAAPQNVMQPRREQKSAVRRRTRTATQINLN